MSSSAKALVSFSYALFLCFCFVPIDTSFAQSFQNPQVSETLFTDEISNTNKFDIFSTIEDQSDDQTKKYFKSLALDDHDEESNQTTLTPAAHQGSSDKSALEERIILERQIQDKPFVVSLHRPNYFLAATYTRNPNRELYESVGRDTPKHYEAKFQFSIRMMVWKSLLKGAADMYAAYTQMSMWQIYSYSSPFRETNYEPEIFLSFDTDFNVLGLTNRLIFFGVNHQSNGMGPDLSRSWNRIFMEFIADKGNFMTGLKVWYRIPEDEEEDDNPDIDKYLGYGQIWGAYKYRKNVFSFLFRNNLRFDHNKTGFEAGWSYPIVNTFRVYVQYYNGYGECLADYNIYSNRISVGVMINDWL